MADGGIQTLSSSTASPGSDVTGFLYTPDLPAGDPCVNASAPWVPRNVTRQGSLPNTDYHLIAVAPWLSPSCTMKYFAAAQQDPVRGFIFFLPNNNTNAPPDPNDATWDLGDGGNWKSTNRFPVYAIPGPTGRLLLLASAQYSGNISSVPYGQQLAASYNPTDYVRLFIDVSIASTSSLPSLWVFLLIVLGILLGIIFAASALMHWLQLKRRRSLRRRVAEGEVDLEALGIQRLTVPQEVLEKMPQYEYGSGKTVSDDTEKSVSQVQVRESNFGSASSQSPRSPTTSTPPAQKNFDHNQQTTCAICLDDFMAASATEPGCTVRELPCRHIFHPECVDTFLRENSSLCPLCKASCLPTGYCPRVITNVMVRRERMVRRMRERIDAGESGHSLHSRSRLERLAFWRNRPSDIHNAETTELQLQESSSALSPTIVPAAPISDPLVDTPRRREWARQRAVAMLGRRAPVLDTEERQQPQTRWQKVLGGVFPGIA